MAAAILCDGTSPWQGVKPSFNGTPPIPSLQWLLVGNSFGDLPRAPKAMGAAREAASSAQSNGSVGSLDRSRSMLWARSATSLALGAERRGRIERTRPQTWRFKRVNGTAYPDSIASSLRDTSGAEAAREAALSAQSNGTARGPGSLPESNRRRSGAHLARPKQ